MALLPLGNSRELSTSCLSGSLAGNAKWICPQVMKDKGYCYSGNIKFIDTPHGDSG